MVKFMEAPLHERIAADLRARIISGDLAVGGAVPSEAELRQAWQGSRGPVRQALAALRAEGLIAGGRGKSPVVQRQQITQPSGTGRYRRSARPVTRRSRGPIAAPAATRRRAGAGRADDVHPPLGSDPLR